MSNLILRDWNGKSIRHREDGFMSLTDMCQAGGKLFGNWSRLQSTQEYLMVLTEKHYSDLNSGLLKSKKAAITLPVKLALGAIVVWRYV